MTAPNLYAHYNNPQQEWVHWSYDQVTNPGNGTIKLVGACTVLGGALALVGIAVGAVALAVFSAMALGPVGFAVAGVVSIALAVSVPMAILSWIGGKLNDIAQDAFTNGSYVRHAYERDQLESKGLVHHKVEFDKKMQPYIAQRYCRLLEDLKTAHKIDRKDLCRAYRDDVHAEYAKKFSKLKGDKKKEMEMRRDIEVALGILEVHKKLGVPKNKI